MGKFSTLLTSLGIGAGLMYFFDPDRGNRRRSLIKDQFNRSINQADEAVDVAFQDLRNRTRGVLAETMGRLSNDPSPDWLIEERLRSELGLIGRHTGGVDVSVKDGKVTLSGMALEDDVDAIVGRTAHVRGVKEVTNRLDVRKEPGDIPALQGRSQQFQSGWSPATRLIGGVGGGLLALYGAARRGIIGTALSGLGLSVAARSLTNKDVQSLLGMSGERDVINIQKGININAPVDKLYRFWSNFENFPRFMQHVRQVKDLGNGRSHWVVAGPAGKDVEWDAVVTEMQENRRISWETVAGENVKNAGTVIFQENPNGGTRLTVRMGYTPPAGAVGHAVATLFGTNPKQAMDDDLGRLKTLFEEGKTRVEGQRLTSEDLKSSQSA